jgi:hypothetical protein
MVEDVGTMEAEWVDPTGTVWPLTTTSDDLGWFTRPEIGGWGAAPYEIVTDPMARGGETVRFVRSKPTRITWPLHVFGEMHTDFVTRIRAVKRAFMLTVWRKEPGILRIRRPDGTGREIECYYEEGFGGAPREDWTYANPVLTLFAPDGYWRDVNPIRESRKYVGAAVNFFNPYPTVASSQVLGATTIYNPGDVLAWPTWTITGPATAVEATNETTGDSFTLTYTLTAGQTITITTLRPTVRFQDGTNLSSALNWPNAVLWALLPDTNDITFTVSGANTGTKIEFEFYARYDGA